VAVAEDGEHCCADCAAAGRIYETTFLVSPNALDKAQMNLWRKKAANIALLSDGLQLLARSSMREHHMCRSFPLFNFYGNLTNGKSKRAASRVPPLTTDRGTDDLTLLLATLVSCCPMRLQRQSNQQIITLDVTSTLGHGGEARTQYRR